MRLAMAAVCTGPILLIYPFVKKYFDGYAKPDGFYGFAEDYSAYQAERAALAQAQSQYLVPLEAGLGDDVDQVVSLFLSRAKAAGLEKIQKVYIGQWKRYCREKGLDYEKKARSPGTGAGRVVATRIWTGTGFS